MPKNGQSRADANRRIRQEALREQLKAKGLLQQYIETIKKIDGLDEAEETFGNSLNKHKTANEQRLKLINKCLPDEKFVEVDTSLSGGITITWDK